MLTDEQALPALMAGFKEMLGGRGLGEAQLWSRETEAWRQRLCWLQRREAAAAAAAAAASGGDGKRSASGGSLRLPDLSDQALLATVNEWLPPYLAGEQQPKIAFGGASSTGPLTLRCLPAGCLRHASIHGPQAFATRPGCRSWTGRRCCGPWSQGRRSRRWSSERQAMWCCQPAPECSSTIQVRCCYTFAAPRDQESVVREKRRHRTLAHSRRCLLGALRMKNSDGRSDRRAYYSHIDIMCLVLTRCFCWVPLHWRWHGACAGDLRGWGAGEQPLVSCRMQEVFGLMESPRLAGGTVPLQMELLSPAGRPLQVWPRGLCR